jgi:hypothetical protein
VGIGFSGQLPAFDLRVPDSKAEAAGEMAAKLGLSWVRDLLEGTPDATADPPVPPPVLPQLREAKAIWFYGRLGFAPVGALAGGTWGYLRGASAQKLDRAVGPITEVLAELQIPDRFEPLLLALVQEKLPGLVVLTNRLPTESTFARRSLMDSVAPLPPEWDGLRTARSDVSAFQGVDVVVLLRVVNWGLSGRRGWNAPLSVSITAKGTLVNARDRLHVNGFYAHYESAKRKFVVWSADHGQPFRAELCLGIQSVAEQIARQVPAPPQSPVVLAAGPAFVDAADWP